MEWYLIGGLVLLVLVILFVKYPNAAVKVLTGHIMKFLKDNESAVVQGVYYALPIEVRRSIPSQYLAEVVSYAIFFIGVLLKENEKEAKE